MKNILYFVSLFALFGSFNLFAANQFEDEWNERVDTDELVDSAHENDNVDVKENLKQDLPNSVNQEDELKSWRNNYPDLDELNTKHQTQEPDEKKVDSILSKEELNNKSQVPTIGSSINEDRKVDEDFGNKLQEDEALQDLPNVIKKENLDLPFIADANANTSESLPQKGLQTGQKSATKDNEPSEDDVTQLLKKKKEEDAKEKKVSIDFKDRNRKNRAKPIAERDEDGEQNEKKNLQKWTKLNKDPTKEWNHKNAQSKSIYKRQYDSLNEHLPPTIFIDDYSKQLFYCIKKNDLSCLRGIISKLERIGLTTQEILRFKNKFGDTPLIYAVKKSEIDIVRFLLLQGADPRVVNNKFQSPIDIAIERKQIDIINAIAEMTSRLLEHRKINNKESSEMYDWARETKESNKSQCDENQTK
ncbi:ankyrin repeat domain-containing protein [Wolbachia endosymbiont of Folsomia candida]|uniref:ankyrin repeat domain-containing protein n=1 Tax=Wolbachia endosymbiont of Folsomia candida TaxID=169402 RepID=UPI000AD4725D|nr:ankyrin repeat domain-containing protein [Wolbachia endosymbiont of Folsomia candida]APR97891.1 hypothetical protein ASM33_00935 [Wolbachia endosymbiont of Folsomia candida]